MSDMKKSILVVEDDSILLRFMVVALRSAGYRVRDARDGEQAKALFLAETPDLLLSDLHMPITDGIQLTTWVRKEQGSDVPIFVLTAMSESALRERILAAGANRVGLKPLELTNLMKEVMELLYQ